MNREIKFRALCDCDLTDGGQGRKMVYFSAEQFDDGVKAWPIPKFYNVANIDNYESPLMQFTGLKDKNEKEIYEGDIVTATFVELHTVRGEVLWDQDRFIVKGAGVGLASFAPQGITEVIGNIYESPHLLSSEQNDERSVANPMPKEPNGGTKTKS